MDLILCHTTADFDTLGAAIALSLLQSGSKVVLAGGSHPTVRDFLALHRDEYPLIERRSVNPQEIRALFVVDTQWRDRLGKAAEWLDLPIPITVYDHHLDAESDILATQAYIEAVGATTTVLVERLQANQVTLTSAQATVMALGIHVDTGSLTFDHTTVRDAAALTWLMAQGASLRAIAEYVEPGLSAEVQDLLSLALTQLQTETVQGFSLAWVMLTVDRHIPGLSSLAAWVMSLTNTDVLLLAVHYPVNEAGEERLTVIGRCRSSAGATSTEGIHLDKLFEPLGGGGHPKAAALSLRSVEPQVVLDTLLSQLKAQIPQPPIARSLMSAPVRTIRPETTIAEAQRILLRYGHSGLAVMDQEQLVGVISRRDLDIALHHGFSHAPVKGYMATNLKTIAPDTTLPDIEALMVTGDIGRLPVLEGGKLVGIVTRTDVLRQLHRERSELRSDRQDFSTHPPSKGALTIGKDLLRDKLLPSIQQVLNEAAQQAEQQGWQLYLVGGAVRDLFLAKPEEPLLIDDIDLVVDGFHPTAGMAAPGCFADTARVAPSDAGVALARSLQQTYPAARLQVHGQFQTAAVLWHNDPLLDSLWVDIATARTEFYPYPAANPEVEASSIRQDLYRRDFSINALAVRLTQPRQGEILDFFGGLLDLEARLIRVLHANSFIEDPTRIYRAVRFAVRLGFQIEPQTEGYIRYAIASGVYQRIQTDKTPALQTRLKQELKYILQAPYWKAAVQKLSDLGALCCIHADLNLTDQLWWRLRLGDRWLKQFDPTRTLPHWQVLLEILLSALEPEQRWKTAERLQLSGDAIERLQRLDEREDAIARCFLEVAAISSASPSQIVNLLSSNDLPTLILLASTQPRPIRRHIWKYLTHWRHIKSPLDGNDLKALGYAPGRQYKQILDALLTAALEGKIATRSEAEAFLEQHFPP
ncbi:MAG: CBS domain-containing protein [Timaviella obliquedivisa GSE-PSE-MK23-08B]|jgi:tRNA nucleotidyltransferase (CCA-adding enzyme)|nr:CBS domain-containing protein [Timaviella obliquedivisa GSE-PSE-MK23-08B]